MLQTDIEQLKKMFFTKTGSEIAEKFVKAETSVRQKASRLRLKKKDTDIWSEKDILLLDQLHPTVKTRSIAVQLNRSLYWVRQKAYRIRLKKLIKG